MFFDIDIALVVLFICSLFSIVSFCILIFLLKFIDDINLSLNILHSKLNQLNINNKE